MVIPRIQSKRFLTVDQIAKLATGMAKVCNANGSNRDEDNTSIALSCIAPVAQRRV